MSIFRQKVLAVVRGIKKGETMTYGEVAAQAGNPRAARAVGTIMRFNYDPKVPCHRVLPKSGGVGNYNRGGAEVKRVILRREGARF